MNTETQVKQMEGEMTYREYRDMIDALLKEGKTTGENQSEALFNYAKMNATRMRRIDKHVALGDDLRQIAEKLNRPQKWTVITEGWCGDAAQTIPVFDKFAEAAGDKVELRFVLRDQHLDLIDQYLTNGGRSIPKLIVRDAETGEELFNWGPRPAEAQKLYMHLKETKAPFKEAAEKLHKWYADNKTLDTQQELAEALRPYAE